MRERNVLGEATEQYTDLKGTVALDNPHEDERLYEIAGLDSERWAIVGVSLAGGRIGSGELASAASVYVVDRSLAKRHDDWVPLARENDGYLPVRQISLDVDDAGMRLLQHVFKRWTIHAVASGFVEKGIDLEITEVFDQDELAD